MSDILQRLLTRLQNGITTTSTSSNEHHHRMTHHPISEDHTELDRIQTLRLAQAAANTANNNNPPVIRSTLNSFLNSSPEGDTALHTLLLLRPSHRVVREMIRLYPEVRLLLASLRYCFGDLLQFQNLTRDFVNARNNSGATALHVALKVGCTVGVVDVLLDEGALEYARHRELNEEDQEDGGTAGSGKVYSGKPSLASVPMNGGTFPLHLACLYPFQIASTPPQQQQQHQHLEEEQEEEEENNPTEPEYHQRAIIERLIAEDPKVVIRMAGWGNTPLACYWMPEYTSSPHYNPKMMITDSDDGTAAADDSKVDILSVLDELDWTNNDAPPRNSDLTCFNESIAKKLTEKWQVSLLFLTTTHSLRRRGQWSGYLSPDDDDDDVNTEEGFSILNQNNGFLKTLCKTPFVPPVMIQLALLFGFEKELEMVDDHDDDDGYTALHYAASTNMIFVMPKRAGENDDEDNVGKSLRRLVRRGKRQKDTDITPDSLDKEQEEEVKEEKKIYRSAVEVLTTACPSAASKRDYCERRLPLHIAALKMKRWEACVECIVSAYPEALVMRNPVTHLFPFMLAAVKDEDASTRPYHVDGTNDCDKKIHYSWSVEDDEDRKGGEEEEEEDGQLTVVFELLRCSPEILSFGELDLLTWGDDEKNKSTSRSSMITSTTRRTGKRVWSFLSSLLGRDMFSSSSSSNECLDDTSHRPQKRRRVS